MPEPENYPEELWGIEDPRITYISEMNKYAIVFTSYSRAGPGVSLALTEDFQHFERYGMIMPPEDKDAALLPHRIGGRLGDDSSAGQFSRRPHVAVVSLPTCAIGAAID